MRKLCMLISLMFLLTGCSFQGQTANEIGNSKTYQFFKKNNYNPEQYTLKLETDNSQITIIKKDNQMYYNIESENGQTTIIQKDNQKYSINHLSKTYTAEPVVVYENYALGYLPEDLDELKKTVYKTRYEKIGNIKYLYESFTYANGKTIYYFQGDELKLIRNQEILT